MADDRDPDDKPTPPWGHRSEPRTPIPPQPATIATIDRRIRDTSVVSNQTLDRVGALRLEVLGHLSRQDGAIEALEGKIDILLQVMAAERKEQSTIRISQVQARIEVEKTGEIAKIDEAKAEGEFRRKRLLQALVVVGPIVSAGIALLAKGC